jgi:serine/threonine protein phosphatase PrpC
MPDGTIDPLYYNVEFDWTKGLNPSCAKYTPGTYLMSPSGYPYYTVISMMRSIGDFYAHPLGLCTDPHVIVQDMDKIPTIFIATDGVWDACDKNNQWTPECSLKSIDKSAHDATHYCETTRKVAVSLFGNGVDDVSVALLRA